jgi:hypothetical protein
VATEILTIPEEKVSEVITVIKMGLKYQRHLCIFQGVSAETIEQLEKWCEKYES